MLGTSGPSLVRTCVVLSVSYTVRIYVQVPNPCHGLPWLQLAHLWGVLVIDFFPIFFFLAQPPPCFLGGRGLTFEASKLSKGWPQQ